jgi:hypothetical protein
MEWGFFELSFITVYLNSADRLCVPYFLPTNLDTWTAKTKGPPNRFYRSGTRLGTGTELHKMQAGCEEICHSGIPRERKLFDGYQFVYVWQSKFQSISLCAVDAASPSLQTSSLLQEEGVYESKTDC